MLGEVQQNVLFTNKYGCRAPKAARRSEVKEHSGKTSQHSHRQPRRSRLKLEFTCLWMIAPTPLNLKRSSQTSNPYSKYQVVLQAHCLDSWSSSIRDSLSEETYRTGAVTYAFRVCRTIDGVKEWCCRKSQVNSFSLVLDTAVLGSHYWFVHVECGCLKYNWKKKIHRINK